MQKIVKIKIYSNPDKPSAALELSDVPWYAGITALQAMVIGEAMHPAKFSFRVLYRDGAFVDSIAGVDGTSPEHAWMFYVNGEPSGVGVSEAVLTQESATSMAVLEWRYVDTSGEQRATSG